MNRVGDTPHGGGTTPRRPILRGLLDVLRDLPIFLAAPLYRRWHLRWGATDDEVRGAMPGDDVVPIASFNATRAITIDAPPERVWPWIVQMGYGRAGFYSYDLLDNAGVDSASRVLDAYQRPRLGDWMPMAGVVNETTAFKVAAFETNEWLLWSKPDSTWAWRLRPVAAGRTRLVCRLKQFYDWRSPAMAALALVLLKFGDFPMMRRALKGIQSRAEHLADPHATKESAR